MTEIAFEILFTPSDENFNLLLQYEMYRIVSGVLNFDKEFTEIFSYKDFVIDCGLRKQKEP